MSDFPELVGTLLFEEGRNHKIMLTYWNEKWLGNFVCEVMKHVDCLCGEGEV